MKRLIGKLKKKQKIEYSFFYNKKSNKNISIKFNL